MNRPARSLRAVPQVENFPVSGSAAANPSPLHTGAAIDAARRHLARTQADDGSWRGDYGGPMFLLPTYVATMKIIGETIPAAQAKEMRRYLVNQQNSDGGTGLHIGGHSMMYPTVVSYVAMRLLGAGVNDPDARKARQWILDHGGATQAAPWGKFILALLGLYDYRGIIPVPPELWLLPTSLPMHPSRFWCHARMVYMPMSYLYGRRAQIPTDALLQDIRDELYPEAYARTDWSLAMFQMAETDAYTPIAPSYQAISKVLAIYEKQPSPALRNRAQAWVLDQIRQEDENTQYICLGPINKLLNLVSRHVAGDTEGVRKHLAQLPEYLWPTDHGLNMNGYNSSALWDTAFAIHAITAGSNPDAQTETLRKAGQFVRNNQIQSDPPQRKKYFRDKTRGAWPFSDKAQGWPTSDCTAEGMKASLLAAPWLDKTVGKRDLNHGADYILKLQNKDGGWPTYERARAPKWLELMNPSGVFGDIVVDYSYPECTSACIQALQKTRPNLTPARKLQATVAIARGKRYLLDTQHPDGSWYGSWGICFTYGTWFGLTGLRAAGLSRRHAAIRNAADFLLAKQQPDGGWGETIESCRTGRYHHTDQSQAVMTSWALLGLLAAGWGDHPGVARGIRFLLDRQRPGGTWPDEQIAGVFNKTCAIHYDNYLKIFPLWALSVYSNTDIRPQRLIQD